MLRPKTVSKLTRIKRWIDRGKLPSEACAKVGVSPSFYYAARKKLIEESPIEKPTRRKARPELVEILAAPAPSTAPLRIVLISGPTEESLNAVRDFLSGGSRD